MPVDPDRPWESADEQAAKAFTPRDTRSWVARRKLWLVAGVVLVGIGVWAAVEVDQDNDRQDAGYSACEDAVRSGLISGYDPGLTVTFEEKQPSGDLAYSVLSDDGDGQWTCTVPSSGDGEPQVTDGLVYGD